MGILGHFLYRPDFGAKGQTEYLEFDGGLFAADAEIYASQLHRLATSNVHGLVFTGPGTGGGLDADKLDGKHATDFLDSESDPVFSASPAFGILADDINNWNSAFGWGDHAGLYSLLGHNHDGVYDPAGTGHAEAEAHVDAHKDLSTGVHGVGAGTIAKVSDIAATKLDDFTSPDDNTDLDASISKHGLMPKTDKIKLDGIEASATKYPDTGEQVFLDADRTKLDGIESGAVALATVKGDADVADAISKKHAQGTDVALGAVGTKNPPIDADKLIYRDSTSSDALVTSTWTQIKAFLKTYWDTLYEALGAVAAHVGASDPHTVYIKHSLATAANDFLVASGAGVFVKKTLAETQALIGAGISAAFCVHRNSVDQTIPTATWTKVEWTTEDYDTHNDFANYKFTPTIAGKYLFVVNAVYLTLVAGNSVGIQLYKNGVTVRQDVKILANNGYIGVCIVAMLEANGSTDYFEVYVYHNYGSDRPLYGAASCTSFTGSYNSA